MGSLNSRSFPKMLLHVTDGRLGLQPELCRLDTWTGREILSGSCPVRVRGCRGPPSPGDAWRKRVSWHWVRVGAPREDSASIQGQPLLGAGREAAASGEQHAGSNHRIVALPSRQPRTAALLSPKATCASVGWASCRPGLLNHRGAEAREPIGSLCRFPKLERWMDSSPGRRSSISPASPVLRSPAAFQLSLALPEFRKSHSRFPGNIIPFLQPTSTAAPASTRLRSQEDPEDHCRPSTASPELHSERWTERRVGGRLHLFSRPLSTHTGSVGPNVPCPAQAPSSADASPVISQVTRPGVNPMTVL